LDAFALDHIDAVVNQSRFGHFEGSLLGRIEVFAAERIILEASGDFGPRR
jgi:hypothetical protein